VRFIIVANLLLVSLALGADAPKLTVGKSAVAPVIDGEIGAAEWADATAFTGFVEYRGKNLDPRPVTGYITCDDRNIYLAFNLPVYPKDAALLANLSRRDGGYAGDDCLEILLDPHAGKYQAEDFYVQFIGNSAGYVLLDQSQMVRIGSRDQREWNGRWTFRNKTGKNVWQAEISLPLADLGVEKIADGDKWLAHFSRMWGGLLSWTTFSPAASALNGPGGAAELTFVSDGARARLLDVTPLNNGRFGFSGEIVGGSRPQTVRVEAAIRSAGQDRCSKSLSLEVPARGRQPFTVDEPVALAEQNEFRLRIFCPAGGEVLYEAAIPFLGTPVYPAFPAKPPKQFAFEARYLPSFRRVWIDLVDYRNFPGRDQVKAAVFSVEREKRVLYRQELPAAGGWLRNTAVSLAGLISADGEYQLKLTLVGAENRELAVEEIPYTWKNFPFAGAVKDDPAVILAPYTPVTENNGLVTVLGRQYKLNGLGLFDRITAEQKEPTMGQAAEELLAGPLELSFSVNGRKIPVRGAGVRKLMAKDNTAVMVESTGLAGSIPVKITTRVEYDGLAWMTISITPITPVGVDGLTLDIPLRENQATLLHEISDTSRRVYAGTVPAGSGAVWDSTRIMNTRGIVGNFKPLYWLGNEDRGLCWCAESDRGWSLDEKKPAAEIIRAPGRVILRLNFINEKTVLDKTRTISFGLQATPVKPLPGGWRGWTGSYSGNLPNLKYFNFAPVGRQATYSAYKFCAYPADWGKAETALSSIRNAGAIPVLYEIVTQMTGTIPEYRTYQGEWGRPNYMSASYADFRIWALREYLTRCGFFTFYEDEAFLLPVKDPAFGYGYARDGGQIQPEYPLLALRSLLRREAALYQAMNLPNYISVHKSSTMMPPCYSFITGAIDGEQRFMITPATDYIDQFPLEFIRAHIMGRQFGFVPWFLNEIHLKDLKGDQLKAAVRQGTRSEMALLLLHEIIVWPAWGKDGIDQETIRQVDEAKNEFGLGAADVFFHPYWENRPAAVVDRPDVRITLWQRPGKVLAVAANLGEKEQNVRLRLNLSDMPLSRATVRDCETGETFPVTDNELSLTIPRHDFRLLRLDR